MFAPTKYEPQTAPGKQPTNRKAAIISAASMVGIALALVIAYRLKFGFWGYVGMWVLGGMTAGSVAIAVVEMTDKSQSNED